jgi:hypothetical protein
MLLYRHDVFVILHSYVLLRPIPVALDQQPAQLRVLHLVIQYNRLEIFKIILNILVVRAVK